MEFSDAGEAQVVTQGTGEWHSFVQAHIHELVCHTLRQHPRSTLRWQHHTSHVIIAALKAADVGRVIGQQSPHPIECARVVR